MTDYNNLLKIFAVEPLAFKLKQQQEFNNSKKNNSKNQEFQTMLEDLSKEENKEVAIVHNHISNINNPLNTPNQTDSLTSMFEDQALLQRLKVKI